MRLEELADFMGWGNHRELKRRYLEDRERKNGTVEQGLVSLGLVEEREGLYALAEEGYVERVEEVRRAPYTIVRRRGRKSTDPATGREVRWVEETENTASEVEREEKDRRDYEDQSRRYRERRSPEAEDRCRELLNAWDEEPVGLAPEEWVDPETGEVLNRDETREPEASDHADADGRVLPFGDLGRLYPLVDQRVITDEGTGVLWQVFSDRVGVLLDSRPNEVTFLPLVAVLEGEEAA